LNKLKSSSERGSPAPLTSRSRQVKIDLNSSADLARSQLERQKEDERQLRVIEEQMILSKQGERAFKRSDGDVKKELRQIRQSVRQYDNSNSIY
jgi:hypothetical protein